MYLKWSRYIISAQYVLAVTIDITVVFIYIILSSLVE